MNLNREALLLAICLCCVKPEIGKCDRCKQLELIR